MLFDLYISNNITTRICALGFLGTKYLISPNQAPYGGQALLPKLVFNCF